MNVYELIVLAIIGFGIWWVWTHAPQIASDNPWKTLMYLVSLAGVVVFFGYFLFSAVDWTFVRFDKDARSSRMLSAVTRALGVSPQDAGLTGQGTFLSREGGLGEVPGLVSAPESTAGIVQIEAAPIVTDLGLIEISPVTLQLANDTLVLLLPDGTAQVKDAAEVREATACGVDTSDVRADGYPVFLVACPFSEGTRFLTASVILPTDFPRVVELVAERLPLLGGAPVETGGGEPVYMTPEEQGACWLDWANSVGLPSITQEQGPLFLPRGTEWRLKGPGNWESAFAGKDGEKFTLSNAELGIDNYPINGWVGRSFPVYDDAGVVVVKGMGDVCVTP